MKKSNPSVVALATISQQVCLEHYSTYDDADGPTKGHSPPPSWLATVLVVRAAVADSKKQEDYG